MRGLPSRLASEPHDRPKGLVHRRVIGKLSGDIGVENHHIRSGEGSPKVLSANSAFEFREVVLGPKLVGGFRSALGHMQNLLGESLAWH